jgi:polar amino acid transport system substrate-binding protein
MKLKYFFTVLFFQYICSSAVAAKPELLLLISDSWCPYNCKLENLGGEGLLVDSLREIFKNEKIEVKYEEAGWTRAIAMVNSGHADAIIGSYDEPKMKDLLKTSLPQGKNINCFFVKSDSNWSWNGISSLDGKVLGAVKDYIYSAEVDAYLAKNSKGKNVSLINGNEVVKRNIEMLQKGRIDILLEDRNSVGFEIAFNNHKGLKEAGCLKQMLPIHIMFSNKSTMGPKSAQILAKKWPAFAQSERFIQLKKKYNIQPEQ